MKVIHFAENSTEIEIVELLANNVSRDNRLSVIKNSEGKILMTGGHLIHYHENTMEMLKLIPTDKLYYFLLLVRMRPIADTEYYSMNNVFKKGDILTSIIDYGKINSDDAALTEGKKYAAIEDSKKGPCGNLVKIIDDKNREITTLCNFFKTII